MGFLLLIAFTLGFIISYSVFYEDRVRLQKTVEEKDAEIKRLKFENVKDATEFTTALRLVTDLRKRIENEK